MNRLILIGNGFDLAHGLKTSYKDFIFWYLDQCFEKAGIYVNSPLHNDEFIQITVMDHHKLMKLLSLSKDKGLSRYLYDHGLLKSYLDFNHNQEYISPNNIYKYRDIINISAHNVSFNSVFFKRLIDQCLECGWVDIEQEYFDALKKYNDSDNSHDLDYIGSLNKAFDFLKRKLEEYLSVQVQKHSIILKDELLDILKSPFQFSDFDTVISFDELQSKLGTDYSTQEQIVHEAYVINFNYTNTFEPYLRRMKGHYFLDVKLNHIHGQIDNPQNPIIFGFGDEHDNDYKLFEEQGNNQLFEHVKSYFYLRTPNYRNLMRFLNKGYFQVFVLGHSCGLSDRTMFKEVFDHENCKSVRVFHYTDSEGKNDFFDKTINLGRHFSDKGRMRKLIVEFNPEDSIPQSNIEY